jgi:F-type H+-transporting ATPase subunit b
MTSQNRLTVLSVQCYSKLLKDSRRSPNKFMDATLHALGGILLRAVPTFLLVIFLNFYLKGIFFKPLGKVLHQRYQATEGARKLAKESRERAAARTAEYQASMRAARNEVYQLQERLHKQLQEQEAAALLAARHRVEAAIQEAKAVLSNDVAAAKASLATDSDALADQIAESILRRSAA